MALLEDFFRGNVLTGVAVGLGMLAYQGLAELGETASDLVAEARAELEQRGDAEAPPSPPPGPRSRSARRLIGGRNSTMDNLTAFGLFAVTAMLVCYALEHRSPWFILAFAGSCGLGSAYGFLQGAWPFGLVEAVWALVA
jgi:hypothetical protein